MQTLLNDAHVVLPGVRRKGYRNWFRFMADAHGFTTKDGTARHKPLKVRVDHGRWITDCPDCKGAECVTLDDPVFLCLSCGNEAVGYRFRRIVFPEDRGKVEALLMARPLFGRNWDQSVSVATMAAQNEAGFHQSWTTPRTWTTGELITAAILNTHVRDNLNAVHPSSMQFVVDGAGAVIPTGSYFQFEVPYDSTISRWTLLGNNPDSRLEVEIWAVSYGGTPASEHDVTASSPMYVASAACAQDTNPSTWSTLTQGQVGQLQVIGASRVTQATVSFFLARV